MKKTLRESTSGFPFSKYTVDDFEAPFQLVFDLEYFMKNATRIVHDFNTYGSCVLQDKDRAYGLMFKDQGGDENDIYMKAYVYHWPQYGILRGGATFYPGLKNFAEELQKAIPNVR